MRGAMVQSSPAPTRDAERDMAADDTERRPSVLLFVMTWDMVRAVLALFVAFASFAGRQENGHDVAVSTVVQVFQALASAALAVSLFLIGTLLTRRSAWIRKAQWIVLGMAIGLNAVTVTVTMVTDSTSRDLATGLGSALFALVDALVIVAMTGPRIRAWFDEPGVIPTYIGALIAFWAASSGAFFVLGLRS
jgi:hypothetical protein